MPVGYLTPAIEDRAVEVQALLADRGQHRAAAVADLLVAATAELAGLIVLHLDKNFDLVAAVTGHGGAARHLGRQSTRVSAPTGPCVAALHRTKAVAPCARLRGYPFAHPPIARFV